jgi:hypothetical protein
MSPAIAKLNSSVVPDHPPSATADLVLEQRSAKERELAALEGQIGETAYVAAISGKSGADALAALHSKIQLALFELDANAAALAFAIQADRKAVAAWWQDVHALPAEEAIEGLTKTECCRRCSVDGCVISGLECAHPTKSQPNLSARHQGNPAVRSLHKAARQKLGVYR